MIPTISEDSDYDSTGASEDENHRLTDKQQDTATPGPIEKMVIASTGVSNLLLVRRLLRESHGDEGQVIELLIQWMADDPDNPDQWWAKDGSADYAGPPPPPPPEDAATLVDDQSVSKPSGNSAAITKGDGTKEQLDGNVDGLLAAASAVASKGDDVHKDASGSAEEPQHHTSKKNQKKPVKGAARQRKAESKKRQKEMAKIKKRQAAGTTTSANSATGPDGSGEESARKLSNQINHIYI